VPSVPTGLTFNTDGTKMFVTGIEIDNNDEINEYDCEAFDVSTCVIDAGAPLNVNAQTNQPTAIAFNTDGTKMFILGNQFERVYEYACGTEFDISTCAFTDFFDVTQDFTATGLAFNTDGTKMFVSGGQFNFVYEYNCPAFDIDTCAYAGNDERLDISGEETDVRSIAFSTDGTKLFVAGISSNAVNEYDCEAFDVSTCVVDAGAPFDISAQEPNVKGIAFSADGLKLFVIGDPVAADSVFEYSLGTAFDVSSIPTATLIATLPSTPSSTPSSLNSSS